MAHTPNPPLQRWQRSRHTTRHTRTPVVLTPFLIALPCRSPLCLHHLMCPALASDPLPAPPPLPALYTHLCQQPPHAASTVMLPDTLS